MIKLYRFDSGQVVACPIRILTHEDRIILCQTKIYVHHAGITGVLYIFFSFKVYNVISCYFIPNHSTLFCYCPPWFSCVVPHPLQLCVCHVISVRNIICIYLKTLQHFQAVGSFHIPVPSCSKPCHVLDKPLIPNTL